MNSIGVKVSAAEIEVLLVVIDTGRSAATTTVLLSRPVGVAGRSFSGSAGAGGGARRCATAPNHVVGGTWTAENRPIESNIDFMGEVTR